MSGTAANERTLRLLAELLRRELSIVVSDPAEAAALEAQLAKALLAVDGSGMRVLRRALSGHPAAQQWVAAQLTRGNLRDRLLAATAGDDTPARYLTVECPEAVRLGDLLPVEVSITDWAQDRSARCRPFAVRELGVDVQLVLADAAGFEVVHGPTLHTVHVPENGSSSRCLFVLKPHSPTARTFTVRAYLDGRPIAELTMSVLVRGDADPDAVRIESAAIATIEPADKHLTLDLSQAGGGYRCLLVHAGDTESGFVSELPTVLVEQVRAQLYRIVAGQVRRAEPAMARRDLRGLSAQLWRAALPDRIRTRFDDMVTEARSFSVVTDRYYDIPWELLLPTPRGNTEAPFLAETLPVLRRIKGEMYLRAIQMREAAYVDPPTWLSDTTPEVTEIRHLLGDRVRHRKPPFVTVSDLCQYLDAGEFDLLHLACHNSRPRRGWQEVAMADGPFFPYNVPQPGALTRRPLIFFNACDSLGSPADTRLVSWAEGFLTAGAGAFIGSTWSVRSDEALRYAISFYRALVGGYRIGEASLYARRELAGVSDDPTRLAYAVYADVETIARWS